MTDLHPGEILSITEKAAERVKALIADKPGAKGLRLGTEASGCSGLGYTMDLVTDINPEDLAVDAHGITVYVAQDALVQVRGTTMDWQDEIFATGFKFTNPNETGRCGCGESFTV